MQLVEKHIVKGAEYHNLCVKAKNLYNQALYYWRQSIFGEIQYFTEYELMGLFAEYKEDSYIALPTKTSQQIIKLLSQNIRSWQIDRAREGRTQTWIVSKMNEILSDTQQITEVQFSRKKKENEKFSPEELAALNTILGTDFK